MEHVKARTNEGRERIIHRLFNELQAHLTDAAEADVVSVNNASLIYLATSVDSLHHNYQDIAHTVG